MRKLIYASLLLSVNVFADCTVSDGTKTYKLPEKTTLSLFDKGRALSTHKIQDQDGLGTCYANTTSAVLKSVYPNHPDISYLHAANASATLGWEQEFKNSGNKYMNKNESGESEYVSGGYVCETIAAMKKAGGACPKSKSILENQSNVDSYVQSRIMKGVGKYFDHLNTIKNDPGKFNELKQELQSAFEVINNESQNLKAACEAEKKAKNPTKDAFRRMMANAISEAMDKEDDCSKKRIESIKKLLGPNTKISQDRVFVQLTDEFENEFSDYVDNNADVSEVLERFFANGGSSMREADTNTFVKKVNEFLLAKIPADGFDERCHSSPAKQTYSFLLGSSPVDAATDILISMKDAKNKDCKDVILESDAIHHLLTANEEQSCLATESFQRILDAVIPLASVGAILNQSLYANLTNPNVKQAFQFTNAIMPGCNKKENLLPMDKVSCASFSMCDQSHYTNDFENNTYTGPKGNCYSHPQAEFITRMKVVNSLRAGKSMAVSVCTAFMDNPKARTDFCRKEVPGIAGHSYHAMAISGYRCNAGKIEYEILNSWGQQCPTKDGQNNEAITCDKNKNGVPNGRFWVKEEVLVDSISALTAVNVKK